MSEDTRITGLNVKFSENPISFYVKLQIRVEMTTQNCEGFIQQTKHTMITAMTPGISGSGDVNKDLIGILKYQQQDLINIKKKCRYGRKIKTAKTIHKPFLLTSKSTL